MYILVQPVLGCPDYAATIIIAGLCAIHTKGEALGVCVFNPASESPADLQNIKVE